MELYKSIELIKSFTNDELLLGRTINPAISKSLESERGEALPPEFKKYIDAFAPDDGLYIETVGNPIELYSREQLSWKMDGYNYNPLKKEPITDWDKSWFLFADEGADPIIVDLSEHSKNSVVYTAMHGMGDWDFSPVADSIGQFLVCAYAVQHALSGFNLDDPIVDEDGFDLAPEPASWLFPFMKKYAGIYYEDWVSVFENS